MSHVTTIAVRYTDMPDGLVELDVQEVTCETCGDNTQGVMENTLGIGICHPCFYGQMAQGLVRVVRAS